MKLNYKQLRREFKSQFDGMDCWASAMGAWFDIAEELYLRGANVPSNWEFKPAPGLKERDKDSFFAYEIAQHAQTKALIRLGNILERYTRILKLKGEDY